MIDLAMMSLVLRCLPESAHVILLGDQNQLASVEPGAVFASLCQGSRYSPRVSQQLSKMTGYPFSAQQPTSQLSDTVGHLQHSYRFANTTGIGALAQGVQQGSVSAVLQTLQTQTTITWLQDKDQAYLQMIAGYQPYFQAAQNPATAITTLFELWEQFRVLTPLREGPDGSLFLNQKINRQFAMARHQQQGWYNGQAILITENNIDVGLYNGDIGIVREVAGEMHIYFMDESKNIRRFTPYRLPQHETAFVMTVHKSQGSEFDRVLCYLPDVHVNVMTRALFYTAVTRARSQVLIYGQESIITQMIKHTEQRQSGLAQRLACD
jgi:exodeoxyribonuclease V alpha subunit